MNNSKLNNPFAKIDNGVAVLAFPLDVKSVYTIGRKMVNIFTALSNHIYFISGRIPGDIKWPEGVNLIDVQQSLPDLILKKPRVYYFLIWFFKNFLIQTSMAWEIIKLRRQLDIVVCFLGNQYQVPILVSKLLGKKVISAAAGIGGDFAKINFGNLFARLAVLSTKFNFYLADIIIIESWRLVDSKLIAPWESKLKNGALFLDDRDLFSNQILLDDRKEAIGYIGRFSPEKGVLELVEAIPKMIEKKPELEIFLIGAGSLDQRVDELLRNHSWGNRVHRHSWVEHREVPGYLNQLRLLIVPSKSEGMPNVILEAIGCGTPVLATPVGGIPDLIADQESGFILSDNSPEGIAMQVCDILEDVTRLNKVAEQARIQLERSYSFDASVERYHNVVQAVISKAVEA